MRQRRGLGAASGLACMLAVVECGIPSESVGERTEDRGEDALASAGGMRGWKRKKRRGRDMGGRDVRCVLHQEADGYSRKGSNGGSVGL